MTVQTPPIVDAQGNLNLHIREDLMVPIQPGDGMGDLTQLSLVFEFINAGIRKALDVHPTEPTWRMVSFTAEELRTVRTGDSFALLDITNRPHIVRWEGSVRRRGQ